MSEDTRTNSTQEEESVKPRREAMKKIGKYAAYTAPAMVTMLATKKGVAGGMSMIPPP